MPRGMFKSRRLRRIFVKTPGGKVHLQYRERRTGKAHCAKCKKVLPGVPQGRPAEIARIAKSSRRPERPYGGILCTRCTRLTLQSRARGEP